MLCSVVSIAMACSVIAPRDDELAGGSRTDGDDAAASMGGRQEPGGDQGGMSMDGGGGADHEGGGAGRDAAGAAGLGEAGTGPGEPIEPPGAPILVSASCTASAITLSWRPPSSGGPVDGYQLLLDGAPVASVPASVRSDTLSALEPATTYIVSVVAVNAGGVSASSTSISAVTEFTPSAFSNTRLWFDADDSSTFIVVSGGVSAWDDKSGTSNHAQQDTASLRPTRVSGMLNGRAVVRFDDSYLTTSELIQLRRGSSGYTVMVVAMNTVADGLSGNPGRGGILLGNHQVDKPNISLELHENRQLRHYWDTRNEPGLPAAGNSGDALFLSPTPKQNEFSILIFYRDAGAAKFGGGVNGILAAELDDAGPNLTISMPFRIGGDYRSSPLTVSWNGDIAEILAFDRLLSLQERARLHAYLSYKWGIPLD
jgi:hypothetical protein